MVFAHSYSVILTTHSVASAPRITVSRGAIRTISYKRAGVRRVWRSTLNVRSATVSASTAQISSHPPASLVIAYDVFCSSTGSSLQPQPLARLTAFRASLGRVGAASTPAAVASGDGRRGQCKGALTVFYSLSLGLLFCCFSATTTCGAPRCRLCPGGDRADQLRDRMVSSDGANDEARTSTH